MPWSFVVISESGAVVANRDNRLLEVDELEGESL